MFNGRFECLFAVIFAKSSKQHKIYMEFFGIVCFLLISVACSHFRSVDYYAESILNPNAFIAQPCPITDILLQRHCFGTLDSASTVIMGEYTPRE